MYLFLIVLFLGFSLVMPLLIPVLLIVVAAAVMVHAYRARPSTPARWACPAVETEVAP